MTSAASPLDGMKELCLFWFWPCLTRSEWAAWVQAVGALLAIGVAVYIARSDTRRRNAELRERRDHAAAICRTSAIFLQMAMESIATACEREQADDIERQVRRLRELVAFARAAPIDAIPPGAVEAFISIRAFAAEAQVDGDNLVGQGVRNYPHWRGVFCSHSDFMRDALKNLEKCLRDGRGAH